MPMSPQANGRVTRERTVEAKSGWWALSIGIVLILLAAAIVVGSVRAGVVGAPDRE